MASSINASTSGAGGVITTADSSGVLNIQTAGTTAVTVDASQNVGIGTSSFALSAAGRGNLEIAGSSTAVVGLKGGSNQAYVFNDGTNVYVANNSASGNIVFQPATNTERMRIDSSGKVGIGMSPTDPLTIQCSSQTFGGGLGFKLSGGANNWGIVVGGDAKLYLGYSATTTPSAVGNFATNGTYTATSDIRKKKDITYTFNGLEIVNALKPAQGRMLEDDNTSPLRPMFIAQDMVDVVPALVSNLEPEPSDDPLLGVDYASITPILVKAIQEQQELIKQLQADVAELKGAV